MGWIYLVLAGIFEIGFTTSMRYLGWPPRPLPLAVFLVFSTASFAFLFAAMRTVPSALRMRSGLASAQPAPC